MKRFSAFSVAIKSLLIPMLLITYIKADRIDQWLLKDGSENQSDINEIDFYPKRDYLFEYNKSYDMIPNNYLNYRDMYGLRYSPNRNFQKLAIDSHEANKNYNNNFSIDEPQNDFIVTTITASIESEAISPLSGETITEPSTLHTLKENVAQSSNENKSSSSNNGVIDTSNKHHIMNPNNRVEHALNFLANRMKHLVYYGPDQKIQESKVSPHLLTLGKFLNLFSLIRFDNIPCLTGRKPLRQLSGTCLNEVECVNSGGISMDRCANGFGVCCIFKSSCGHVTYQNVTYFESPNFPLASQNNLGACTLTILLARNVKQLFLEFIFFETLPPTNGNCEQDQFTIHTDTGSMHKEVPIICGIATGQHMYVEVSGTEKIFLSLLTNTAEHRAFSIKVSQLTVFDNVAPTGCLQYLTETNGQIKSFNYDDGYSQVLKYRNPSYFNNMNYAICIKRALGYCTITYTNEYKGREEVFELVNTDANGNIIAPGQAGAEIFGCPDDFLAVNYIRICGYKLNDGALTINFNTNEPVTSIMNGPIVVPVKTDNETVGRGFSIYYYQQKC
ncbi:uncharacterized protein [Chironomus tepperi]|uniref:uncharacterized protein n=1 Tax=Chironomus tepperi TaxID=113505 RepID=UPI00391F34AB